MTHREFRHAVIGVAGICGALFFALTVVFAAPEVGFDDDAAAVAMPPPQGD